MRAISVIRLILSRSMFMSPRLSDKNIAMEYLRNVPLYASLPDEALKAVAQRLILRHVPQGELVYAEGSPGEALYIIDDGEVEVISSANKDHQVLGRLRDGEYFGEASLLPAGRGPLRCARSRTPICGRSTVPTSMAMSSFSRCARRWGTPWNKSCREADGVSPRSTVRVARIVCGPFRPDRTSDSGNSRNCGRCHRERIDRSCRRNRAQEPVAKRLPPGEARIHDEAPALRCKRQTTQVVRASPQGMDALEREFVPSRQREEFIRSKAVAEREPATSRKPVNTTTQKAVSPRGALRQETVAPDMLPLSQRGRARTVQPATHRKKTHRGVLAGRRSTWVAT